MRIAGLIIFILFFGVPVLVFVLILKKFLGKAKRDEWEGEVVDKQVQERREDKKIKQYYSVILQTTAGRRSMGVSAREYHKLQVGDKFRKIAGRLNAQKLE